MTLSPLTLLQVLQVAKWRNEERQFLRTPHFITEEMQTKFYHDVVCNTDSKHRYYAIDDGTMIFNGEPIPHFIGMGGLTNIDIVAHTAEISLIISPQERRHGYGIKAVDLLLAEGFGNMGLEIIYGEVYNCGNRTFWEKVVKKYDEESTIAELTGRKMWAGKLWDSMWFCIRREKWSA